MSCFYPHILPAPYQALFRTSSQRRGPPQPYRTSYLLPPIRPQTLPPPQPFSLGPRGLRAGPQAAPQYHHYYGPWPWHAPANLLWSYQSLYANPPTAAPAALNPPLRLQTPRPWPPNLPTAGPAPPNPPPRLQTPRPWPPNLPTAGPAPPYPHLRLQTPRPWPEGFTLRGELRWGRLDRVFGPRRELPEFVREDLRRVYGTYPRTHLSVTYRGGEYAVRGDPRVGEQEFRLERRVVRQADSEEGDLVSEVVERRKRRGRKGR